MKPMVHRSSVTQQVPQPLLQQIREDILGCALAPGERLKFEALRARYGSSMGSLREALTRLATEGLVLAEANRGFTVAPVSVADLLDITELRVDLECKALVSAIQQGGDDWESNIVVTFHLLRKIHSMPSHGTEKPGELWARRHREFHNALVAACTSPWVLRFRETLFDQARRYRSLSMKHSRAPGRIDQHEDLMEAVVARDTARACELAEVHIRETARNTLYSLPDYAQLESSTKTKAGDKR